MYSVLLRTNSYWYNNCCKSAKSERFIHYTTVNKHVTLDIFHLTFVYGHCTDIIEQGAIAISRLFARAVLVAALICIKDNVSRSALWRCYTSIPFARKNPYPYYTHWSGPPAEVFPRFTLQPPWLYLSRPDRTMSLSLSYALAPLLILVELLIYSMLAVP